MYKIYKLIDPISFEVRYIGRTKQGLIKRLNRHLRDSYTQKTHKANWIGSLVKRGLKPIMEVLQDNILTLEEADKLEITFIDHYKSLNCDLTNSTNGGGGAKGFRHSPEAIKKLKTYSHPHTEETKRLMSEARRNTKIDKEVFDFKTNNPQMSNRKIAEHFKTNGSQIGRILKRYSSN
jgi:hypothetical protein